MMKWILIIGLLVLPMMSAAQEPGAMNDYEMAQQTMLNTGNQFIYSIFGKDLLIAYLNDPLEIEAIRAMSDVEMETLARPFNSNIAVFTMAVMAVCYGLLVVYFLFKLAVVVLTEMWVFQSTGKMQMSRGDIKGIALKAILIGAVVLAPVSVLSNGMPFTNGFTYLVFDLLGRSHAVTDDAVADMVLAHRENLQTIRLPAAAAKYNEAIELNKFMACVASDRERSNTSTYASDFTLYKVSEASAAGHVIIGDCWLEVNVGIDNESPEMVRRLKVMDPSLSLNPEIFIEAQKQGIMRALGDMFNVASEGADILAAKPISGELDQTDNLFDQYTARFLSASDLKMWSQRCPAVLSESLSQDAIYEQDRRIYNQLLARCSSASLTSRLVYPEGIHAMDNILNNDVFNQKVFPLCYSKAQIAQLTQGTQGAFTPRYVIDDDDNEGVPDSATISLRACVAQACTLDAMAQGNMYACTQALDLYEARKRDHNLAQRGIFSMGFHMMSLFMEAGPSMSAKRTYNSIKIRYLYAKPSPITDAEKYVDVPFIVPAKTGLPEYTVKTVSNLDAYYDPTVLPAVDVPSPEPDMMSFMGARRLLTCAKNPLQLEGRYACGSIPQEFSRFGMAMLHNVVLLKTSLVVGDSLRAAKTMRQARGGGEQGTISSQKGSGVSAKSVMVRMGTALSGAFGSDFAIGTVIESLGLQQNVTDEFGEVTTEAVSQWVTSGTLLGTVILANQGAGNMQMMNTVVSMLDTALMMGLIFGVVTGFLIALYPAFLLVKAVVKFIHLLFKTFLVDAFRLVDSIFDDDIDLLNDAFNRVVSDLLSLVIKFPLTIAGVWLAWLMSNIVVAHVLDNITLTFITNDGEQGMLDVGVTIVFTLVIVVLIYNMIMSIIESFYQVTVEWLQGMMSNDPFTASRLDIQEARSFLRMVGR